MIYIANIYLGHGVETITCTRMMESALRRCDDDEEQAMNLVEAIIGLHHEANAVEIEAHTDTATYWRQA